MGLQDTLLGTPGQTQVHQTGATRPPGYHFAQDVYRTLEQLMNSGAPFPTYQGNLDPGLSPTLQNSLRMAQGYAQSSPSEALSGINGVLGRFMNPTYSNPSGTPGGDFNMPFSGQFRPNAPTYNGGRVGGYDPQMSNQTGGGLLGGGQREPDFLMNPPPGGGLPNQGFPMPPGGGGNAGRPIPRPGGGMPGGNMGGGAPQYGPPKQPGQGSQQGSIGRPTMQSGGGYTPPWAPPSQGGPPIGQQPPWGNKIGNVGSSGDTFDPNTPFGGPYLGGGRSYGYGNDGRAQQIPQRGPSIDPMGGGMPYGNDAVPRSMPGGQAVTRPMQIPYRGWQNPMNPWGNSGPGVDPMMPGGGQGQPPMLSFPGSQGVGMSGGNMGGMYSIPGGPGGQQVDPMIGAQSMQGGGAPGFDFGNYLRSFLNQGQGGG